MKLKKLDYELTVCKVKSVNDINYDDGFFFVGRTDEEISLVCETSKTPQNTQARDDGWSCFRIEGVLDFSLIGILSEISAVLAAEKIGIFVVSTFNTDYILVKRDNFDRAMSALKAAGYDVI